MSDMYPTKAFEQQVLLTADNIIRDHGREAFAVAQRQIAACNARGEFSIAESWVAICRRIRELQVD